MSARRAERRREERGATAVMMAILAMVLLGVGAFAVDFGQVYAKRSALQSNVDLAVLAAAAELDGTNICTEAAFLAAEDYLTKSTNEVPDQIVVNLRTGDGESDVGTDGFDGHMKCTGWRVRLWAPQAVVDFGLAKALGAGNDGVEVPAYAEAGVYSPATGVMPAFAVAGCDYGPETLLDPPVGHEDPYVPTLVESASPNSAGLASLNANTVSVNQSFSLEITGKSGNQFTGVTWVSFTTEAGDHVEVPVGAGPPNVVVNTAANPDVITVTNVPASVVSVEEVWWVRVSKEVSAAPSTWSTPAEALPLRVGDPRLECAGESNEGNFGTIDLPSINPNASAEPALEWNMIGEVDHDLTTLLTGGTCTPGVGGAVAPSSSVETSGVNCVLAEPGFSGTAATGGLITGRSGVPGRLDAKPTGPNCSPTRTSSDWTTPERIAGSYYTINDDVLSCFLTDTTTTIGTITQDGGGYDGGQVISGDIFESPRYFWVPVFSLQPTTGSSQHYAIVDFRPAFITSEAESSSRGVTAVMDDSNPDMHNGLVVNNAGIQSLKVIFFDVDALPEGMAGGPVMDYLGVGTKVIQLID